MINKIKSELQSQLFGATQTEVNNNVLRFESETGAYDAFHNADISDLGFAARFSTVNNVPLLFSGLMLYDKNQLLNMQSCYALCKVDLFNLLFLHGYFYAMQNYEEHQRYYDNDLFFFSRLAYIMHTVQPPCSPGNFSDFLRRLWLRR